jgi:sugar O-acyltransferase (sialic acid O-acetyltransferase NeuD family)
MTKIVLWGTGQIAQVVYYYLTNDSDFEICGFCVDKEYLTHKNFYGKPVVAFEDIEKIFPPTEYKMAIPIGYKNTNKYREDRYIQAKEKGYKFITYISSKSSVDTKEVGENTFIFNFNDIQPFTKIGNNVIIWANTGIGHHALVEDNCFLASPKISGATVIGKNSFLGTNVTVADKVKIGSHCIIGAGVVINRNVKDGSVIAVKQAKTLPFKSWEMEDILS